MNKYWTIGYKNYEGLTKYAKVVTMDLSKAVAWVCEKNGIDSNQITYASGEEVEVL